jgi:hypothetical protein
MTDTLVINSNPVVADITLSNRRRRKHDIRMV